MSRWMQLMTVILVGLVALALAIGILGLRHQRIEEGVYSQRNAARSALQTTQVATVEAQTLLSQAASAVAAHGPKDPGALMALSAAAAQQQGALADWSRYQLLSQRWAGGGPQAQEIDEDLGRLAGVTGSALVDGGTNVSLTPKSLALEGTLSSQVSNSVAQLRTSDIAWWTTSLNRQRAVAADDLVWLEITGAVALIILVAGNTVVARTSRRREGQLVRREADLADVAASSEFEARLQRALEMSADEDSVHRVTRQALEETVPELGVEVLLADSSRAHFHRLLETGNSTNQRCSVQSPLQCPAARRGEVLLFSSSRALDACPYLVAQTEPCSSMCVPVSVSGTTVGVVHAVGPHDQIPAARSRISVELIARRASDRIGSMRAFARTEVQASTDPLTGLFNRRAFEDEVSRFAVASVPYAVAFGDLDRFKMLNDVHGHGAGDQALRIFARVLRESLRPGDLAGRYGGEEFVLALPNCDSVAGAVALQRIQQGLARMLDETAGPSFTVSFGLATGEVGCPFDALVDAADKALLEAKRLGRDRIVVADSQALIGASPVGHRPAPAPPTQTIDARSLDAGSLDPGSLDPPISSLSPGEAEQIASAR